LTVVFGIGLILLLLPLRDAIGTTPVIWAALFTAVSPAFVFYSRYYIHEMLLVFFTALAITAGWRYWRSRKLAWALLAGAGVGLMHATKETFIISLSAILLALVCNQRWYRLFDVSKAPDKPTPWNHAHTAVAAAVWLVIALLLFSSFGANTSGISDSVRTYSSWFNRAGGESPHIYPWPFYFQRVLFFHPPGGPAWSEALIGVLAIIGAAAGFVRRALSDANGCFVRFIAFYTFILAGEYLFISYKTPWCLLGFWHVSILLG